MIRFHSASSYSAVGAGFLGSMPALLKAKWSRPNAYGLVQSRLYVLGPRHVAPDGERSAALLLDQAGRLLVALLGHIGRHHAGPLAGEGQRRRATNAARGPGHERDLPCEISVRVRRHVWSFPSSRSSSSRCGRAGLQGAVSAPTWYGISTVWLGDQRGEPAYVHHSGPRVARHDSADPVEHLDALDRPLVTVAALSKASSSGERNTKPSPSWSPRPRGQTSTLRSAESPLSLTLTLGIVSNLQSVQCPTAKARWQGRCPVYNREIGLGTTGETSEGCMVSGTMLTMGLVIGLWHSAPLRPSRSFFECCSIVFDWIPACTTWHPHGFSVSHVFYGGQRSRSSGNTMRHPQIYADWVDRCAYGPLDFSGVRLGVG
jgi:hypothetical protein